MIKAHAQWTSSTMLSGIILTLVGACGDASTTDRSRQPGAAGDDSSVASPPAAGTSPTPPSVTTPPAATAPPALPVGDLAAAQAFIEPFVLGINIERGWAWSLPGGNTTSSTQYFDYLRTSVHATHVRFFYPWRPSATMGGGGPNNSPPDEAAFGRILDAAAQAIKSGLVVFLDFTDVMGPEDFAGDNGAATETHLTNAAMWSAARKLDPNKIAYGAVNEWARGDDKVELDASP